VKVTQWIYFALLLPFLALTTHVIATVGFAGFYAEALRSPATVLMGMDLAISLGLVLAWMWNDARETRTPFLPYLLVTLAIGVAGPLLYLIHRDAVRARAPARAAG
jgi:hypothetical protein